MGAYFRADNTQGYSPEQLEKLNARLRRYAAEAGGRIVDALDALELHGERRARQVFAGWVIDEINRLAELALREHDRES